jgi:site-specific DNA-cytosine methylase
MPDSEQDDNLEPRSVWENQQAYVWLTNYSNAVACGGGKPGQGYVAVLQAVPIAEELMTDNTYITDPIAFNWQSGGDCRLNPSTEGTDALTVSQLPAVMTPKPYTVHGEHSTAMTGNGNADVAFETDTARTLDTTGGYASNQGGTVVGDLIHDDQESALLPSSGSQDPDASIGGERNTHRWVVRKLTPLECERLMGWPDEYTMRGITDDGEEVVIAKTSRYKICGNGIVSPVTEWIGSRIMDVMS